jgi:hypothetical protein
MKMKTTSPRPPRRRLLALTFAALLGWAFAPGVRADSCQASPESLTPGVPVSGLTGSGSCPSGPIFFVEVPAGATQLTFTTAGGDGNADLLVQLGSIPISPGNSEYHSGEPGNAETVRIDNPPAGTWYAQVYPRPGFTGVTLTADLVAPETDIQAGVPQTNLADAQLGGIQYFNLTVPPGIGNLTITTAGGTGNADLYVRRGALPTTSISDASSKGGSNAERIDIPSPQGGNYKIALVANAPFNGLTLLVTLTPSTSAGACVATPTSLCLLGNRFQVDVTWIDQHSGGLQGVGTAIPSTDQTGYFWFFSIDNTELVVKMVDGRPLNNHFWVFRGGLSDVDYTIRVTDTATGAVQTYRNPANSLTSGADTSAF